MNKAALPAIAIIADAHVHDINSDYDFDGALVDGKPVTIRSWTDTRRSSRVFNESKAALVYALQDIDKRGIKHVVLLGDYTDDGQIESTTRLVDTLRQHRDRFGTHFYAVTGNHDAFGPSGKHQSTRFSGNTGDTILVTSDPKVAASEPDTAVLTPKMYCEGVADGIARMSEFGLFNQPEYLHWESPFGQSDSIETRHYESRSEDGLQMHKLVDASYLVEPVAGLWLLMIDANVFEPRNGQWRPAQKKAFLDSSDAGWNSMLKNRPYMINWITDVCRRADRMGKSVIAFSHYPIIDPFDDTDNSALTLFGDHEMHRRKPEPEVCQELLNAGLRIHFSGHLHVSALSQRTHGTQVIIDCAVPSLVAFPACYNVVNPDTVSAGVSTVHLSSMPLDSSLMEYYSKISVTAHHADHAALSASNYGNFLYRRMHCRVIHHFLEKEWPEDIAAAVRTTTTFDLAMLMLSGQTAPQVNASTLVSQTNTGSQDEREKLGLALAQYGLCTNDLVACPMTQLIADWYCLRHAGAEARQFIEPANFKIYSCLSENFADRVPTAGATHTAFFAVFLSMLRSSIQRSSHLPMQGLA